MEAVSAFSLKVVLTPIKYLLIRNELFLKPSTKTVLGTSFFLCFRLVQSCHFSHSGRNLGFFLPVLLGCYYPGSQQLSALLSQKLNEQFGKRCSFHLWELPRCLACRLSNEPFYGRHLLGLSWECGSRVR